MKSTVGTIAAVGVGFLLLEAVAVAVVLGTILGIVVAAGLLVVVIRYLSGVWAYASTPRHRFDVMMAPLAGLVVTLLAVSVPAIRMGPIFDLYVFLVRQGLWLVNFIWWPSLALIWIAFEVLKSESANVRIGAYALLLVGSLGVGFTLVAGVHDAEWRQYGSLYYSDHRVTYQLEVVWSKSYHAGSPEVDVTYGDHSTNDPSARLPWTVNDMSEDDMKTVGLRAHVVDVDQLTPDGRTEIRCTITDGTNHVLMQYSQQVHDGSTMQCMVQGQLN